MTMETFPHSGQLLASVHPCKHASVMKKFIDRMDDARKITDDVAGGSSKEETGSAADKSDKKKKGWGLGGVVRKVTGGSSSSTAGAASTSQANNKPEEVQGVQVDFYMVIVSHHSIREKTPSMLKWIMSCCVQFLKFIASIVPTIEVDNTTSF